MTAAPRDVDILPTPPMLPGLSQTSSMLEWQQDHAGFFQRAYEQLGPVFGVQLGPQQGTVLVGPRYHEFFFKEVDNRLSVPEQYRFVVPMFGEVALAATDTATRRRHVALMQSAFQGRRLSRYTEQAADETEQWLDSLGANGRFDLWNALEGLAMRIAASTLLGPEVRARIDDFRPLLADLARGMDFVLPPDLPLPKFVRRDRARRLLTEMIQPVLAERRRRSDTSPDFLQTLIDDPGVGDEGDDVLVGMALMTIFTGYITTCAQLAWALVLLLQHPAYLESVIAEVDAARTPAAPGSPPASTRPAVGGDRVPPDARLPRLEWALKEAIRLRPVMSHYARYNRTDIELDGYRLPAGWLTMLCPSVAHRLPELFTDPDRYDPERFSPGRAEDRRHPYALIGFSGGFYRCPGSAFGMNEMRVVIASLLARFDLVAPAVEPLPSFDMGVTRPTSPCIIEYRTRN
ncbi:cytochrome P450 [Micromonospora sonneratiae]|uniref:Cytochrome P450 n=1 Tax=Micromonospora sonneratiae TaxID=1184706 RepID=A0ABW3YD39_9ACTN